MIACGGVDHCYSDLGCFPLSDEFYHPRHRPFNVRPWHRRHIRTQFELFNARHPRGFALRPWNRLNLVASGFDPRLETKVIVPGWLDNVDRAVWVKQLRDALLWLWAPANILVVRWRNFTPYTIATANTRVVGAELANLIKFVEHAYPDYQRAYYHVIGHSLGAHIGGYCGDRVPGLGRITALDPARPFFQGMPKAVRLDRGDAKFIDAIHSDFTPENAIFLLMSFGMTTPVGHLDFYPNGPPLLQPGCLRDMLGAVQRGIVRGLQYASLSISFLEAVRYLTACDHQRSHEWFIESIVNRECLFVGVRCNQFEGIINGRCTCDDSPSACAIMGIHADQMYLENVHQDLWPPRRPPPVGPSVGGQTGLPQATPPTREHTYARLKMEAHRLRQPPEPALFEQYLDYQQQQQQQQQLDEASGPPLVPSSGATPNTIDGRLPLDQGYHLDSGVVSPETLEDLVFVDYLRATLLGDPASLDSGDEPTHAMQPHLEHGDLDYKRRADQMPDPIPEEMEDGRQRQPQPPRRRADDGPRATALDGHPQLLSDVDRNIENWYEENSRWYLKTNNRPNYCANQYQVLIFIGPLNSAGGRRDRLRANLLISIIGSRGQLLNQRFVPRSASLDSYTMQPFFILLEGSYSLGHIQSVAIGWEARTDPDPIQATISFQNNQLASIETKVPAFKVKHPLLSETIKFDRSQSFQWRPIVERRLDQHSDNSRTSSLKRRQWSNTRQVVATTGKSKSATKVSSDDGRCSKDDTAFMRRQGFSELDYQADEPIDYDYDVAPEPRRYRPKQLVGAGGRPPNYVAKYPVGKDMDEQGRTFMEPLVDPTGVLVDKERAKQTDGRVSIDFHNVPFITSPNMEEDTIVVNQVIISPLQANYGRLGRNAKTFCPPKPNARLRREQTVRLRPSFLDRCHQSVS